MRKEFKGEEAMNLSPVSYDIWDRKYRLKDFKGNPIDSDINDTIARVAKAVASVERTEDDRRFWESRFKWAMENGAIPAGRILSNAGAGEHKPATSLLNCSVSNYIRDDMESIMDTAKNAAITLKAGIGIGYCFSTLRPSGAYVAGSGSSTSGPLPFMDIFDAMCRTVSSAGGRRGAQMGTFSIRHPDVEDFIKAKREDGRLRQFNLSVLITDEFIQAVKDDSEWELAFPANSGELADASVRKIKLLWPTETGADWTECRVYRTVRARELWDLIMQNTYNYAEPGVMMIDRMNAMNPLHFAEHHSASNPCVTSDSWILTDKGPKQIIDLVGTKFNALVDGRIYASTDDGAFFTGEKQVLEITTQTGHKVKCTEYHKLVKVVKGDSIIVEANELVIGDELRLQDQTLVHDWEGTGGTFAEGYLLGSLIGDGHFRDDGGAILELWKIPGKDEYNAGQDRILEYIQSVMINDMTHKVDFTGWKEIKGRNSHRIQSAALTKLATKYGLKRGAKVLTSAIEASSSEFHKGFLRAFFDCDGTVSTGASRYSVRLSQANIDNLEAVQRMLSRFGIVSTIYKDRAVAGYRMMPDGKGGSKEYWCKAVNELIIFGRSIITFLDKVGFLNTEKRKKVEYIVNEKKLYNKYGFKSRITSIRPIGMHPVYCCTIPGKHIIDVNGIYSSQCSEQNLPHNGTCLLGSVDLTQFIIAPFTDHSCFADGMFRDVVSVFTRMLDNVVDINGLPLEAQRTEIKRTRRHGMGFTGLGSAMAMLGIKYGSPASIEFTHEVCSSLVVAGWQAGIDLAREKGAAPIYMERYPNPDNRDTELRSVRELVANSAYFKRMVKFAKSTNRPKLEDELERILADIRDYGCRFTHHSSIAPTGTISLAFGNNCSNGIEPSFAHRYKRNIIREGKKSKEQVEVVSAELAKYIELHGDSAELPESFVVADQLSPKEHIDVQAAAQLWIDSSISKTINVPTNFPYEEFKDIYMYAYSSGCKGCTTFRFNPEVFQGVLVKTDDLKATRYRFKLANGEEIEVAGDEDIEYDGEHHSAANLFDALKEGYYGKL
jgi:ribonucleoside-diphosphate reductase alpha chain